MSETVRTIEIRDGIEWFVIRHEDGDSEDGQCARCGSSVRFHDCWHCGGEGDVEYDSPEGWFEGDFRDCPECSGTGGSWHCASSREWCEAHPLSGREHITSTAFSEEAQREL